VAKSDLDRKFIRVRDKNQITLPTDLVSALAIQVGDFLEAAQMADGSIQLRPTRLVTVGTPAAEREEALAKEDIRKGRFGTYESADDLVDALKKRRKKVAATAVKAMAR